MKATEIIRPYLGSPVRATHRLARSKDGNKRKWERIDWKDGDYVGYYMGYRTLSNGSMSGSGDGYSGRDYFEAWMVIRDEITNPIFLMPEDCEYQKVCPFTMRDGVQVFTLPPFRNGGEPYVIGPTDTVELHYDMDWHVSIKPFELTP